MRAFPPPASCTFSQLFSDQELFARVVPLLQHPLVNRIERGYKPWRAVRPMAREKGLDPIDVWGAVKLSRLSGRRTLPFTRWEGGQFGITETRVMSEQLHRIDQLVGGGGAAAFESRKGLVADKALQRRFIIRSMMEEAIESSRVEGAVTTRNDALDLLRSGRHPQSEHERMVVNNYAAMQDIKTWTAKALTIKRLHELQRILTEGTLRDPSQGGRFRLPEENVRVVDDRTSETVFTPPPADGLSTRIQAICDFANASHTGQRFIHPIVKACVLHFMIGYEHPYCDGNGRTARAVFYWCALKSGYRVFEYMVISELIRKSFGQYAHAYLNSELDDGDVTYFVFYNLRIIMLAIERFVKHLDAEEEKIQRGLQLAAMDPTMNLRQRLLLDHAIRHPRTAYTVKSHATSNRITPNTARSDLDDLVKRGLLNTIKAGRLISYLLAPNAADRLASQD